MPGFNFKPDPRLIVALAKGLSCETLRARRAHHERLIKKWLWPLAGLVVAGLICVLALMNAAARKETAALLFFLPAAAVALVTIYHIGRSDQYESAISLKKCLPHE